MLTRVPGSPNAWLPGAVSDAELLHRPCPGQGQRETASVVEGRTSGISCRINVGGKRRLKTLVPVASHPSRHGNPRTKIIRRKAQIRVQFVWSRHSTRHDMARLVSSPAREYAVGQTKAAKKSGMTKAPTIHSRHSSSAARSGGWRPRDSEIIREAGERERL